MGCVLRSGLFANRRVTARGETRWDFPAEHVAQQRRASEIVARAEASSRGCRRSRTRQSMPKAAAPARSVSTRSPDRQPPVPRAPPTAPRVGRPGLGEAPVSLEFGPVSGLPALQAPGRRGTHRRSGDRAAPIGPADRRGSTTEVGHLAQTNHQMRRRIFVPTASRYPRGVSVCVVEQSHRAHGGGRNRRFAGRREGSIRGG